MAGMVVCSIVCLLYWILGAIKFVDMTKKNHTTYLFFLGTIVVLAAVFLVFQARSSELLDDKQGELRDKLTTMQYKVTQQDGTEPAYNNEYWDNHAEGIYVDIVSGEPLFSSRDKYDSQTGWPSFVKPLAPDNIVERTDRKIGVERTEVRSAQADSHLGHLFDDGPTEQMETAEGTGDRYCINSAALRFVPKEKLDEQGYGEYISLFE